MRFRAGAVALLFLMASAIGALAQTTTVQGFVKDPSGPVVGAQVQLKDIDTGRKYTLKTDKKGKFFSIGITPGKFDVSVSKDNKVLYTTQFQASLNAPQDVNELDIDLTPAQPGQAAAPPPPQPGTQQQQPKLTEEQKKQIEEINKKNAEIMKENAKIGNLNTLLKEAQADMQAKNYDQAVTTMQQAEQADNGQHHQVYGVLGAAYLNDKKYPEAIDALNKAVQLANPGTGPGTAAAPPNTKAMLASYYDNLGQAYAKSGKIPEAVDAYNKEVEQDPTHASQAYYNEGAVLTNAGKTDEANAAFTKSIQADPNHADSYYQRAINSLQKATVDKSGKMVAPPGTVDDFNKYLELQPTGPYAEGAKQMLETLGAKVQTQYGKKK